MIILVSASLRMRLMALGAGKERRNPSCRRLAEMLGIERRTAAAIDNGPMRPTSRNGRPTRLHIHVLDARLRQPSDIRPITSHTLSGMAYSRFGF